MFFFLSFFLLAKTLHQVTILKSNTNTDPIVDVILSLAWFAAFGILVDAIHKLDCGSIWHWGGFLSGDTCGRWKAAEAFAFLSAFVWLVSGIVVCFGPFKK